MRPIFPTPTKKLKIRKLQKDEYPPWNLLLQHAADRELVHQRIRTGSCYVAILEEEVVGAYILSPQPDDGIELTDFCYDRQKPEMAASLLASVIEKAKSAGAQRLIAGVPNASFSLLELLQKRGFRITGVVPDYYLRMCRQRRVEHGILCRDMLRLVLALEV